MVLRFELLLQLLTRTPSCLKTLRVCETTSSVSHLAVALKENRKTDKSEINHNELLTHLMHMKY
jgi:hypothetical protein